MKRPTEQDLARQYLFYRERGYSLRYVLRKSIRQYVIHFSLLAVFVIALLAADGLVYKGVCLLGIGIHVGAIARDIGWLRRTKTLWPFSKKIIDWHKVEDIAAGEENTKEDVEDVGTNGAESSR